MFKISLKELAPPQIFWMEIIYIPELNPAKFNCVVLSFNLSLKMSFPKRSYTERLSSTSSQLSKVIFTTPLEGFGEAKILMVLFFSHDGIKYC